MDLFKNSISDMKFNHDLSGSVFYHGITNRKMIHTGIESEFEARFIIPDFSEIFTFQKSKISLYTAKRSPQDVIGSLLKGELFNYCGFNTRIKSVQIDTNNCIEKIIFSDNTEINALSSLIVTRSRLDHANDLANVLAPVFLNHHDKMLEGYKKSPRNFIIIKDI